MNDRSKIDINKLLDGEKVVWDEFVDRYSGIIYSAVMKVFQGRCRHFDISDVREVVQNVFLKLVSDNYRLLRKYDSSRASLSTWLTIVTRSTAIDYLRSSPDINVSIDEKEINLPAVGEVPDLGPLLPEGFLTARQTMVLHLIFNYNMGTREIAELLDIEEQTVRSCKHKAINKLRVFLKQFFVMFFVLFSVCSGLYFGLRWKEKRSDYYAQSMDIVFGTDCFYMF